MIITTLEEFKKLTQHDEIISLDIETKGNNPSLAGSKIVGIGIYVPTINKTIYVPIYKRIGYDVERTDTETELLIYLAKEYFKKVKVICHNSGYEYKWFKYVCNIELNIYFDTRYAWYLINPEMKKYLDFYSLDKAIKELLEEDSHKHIFETHLRLLGYSSDNGEHWCADTDILASYCEQDCFQTYKLFEYLRGFVEKYESVSFFQNFLIPYGNMLAEQSYYGMEFNSRRAKKYASNLIKMSNILEHKIRSLCYNEIEQIEYKLTKKKKGDKADQIGLFGNDYVKFNFNSPDQKAELLEKLGISIFETTEGGGISTSFETLDKYKDQHPVLPLIIKHASIMSKLNFTNQYINASINNKYYLDCDPCATASGRTAAYEPNFLAINRSDNRLMKCFEAEKDYVYFQSDYSNVEPRITCHYAKDERMKEVIDNKWDSYLEYIKDIFPDKAYLYDRNDISGSKKRLKVERDLIKTGVLAMTYGAGIATIAERTNTDIETATKIFKGYWKANYKVKNLENKILKYYMINGYIKNLFGRPVIMRNTKDILNRFIQSSGHDCLIAFNMILKGLIDKPEIGGYERFKPICIDLHDEYIFKVHKQDIQLFEELTNKALKILNDKLQLYIPLEMSGKIITDMSQLEK